MFTPLIAYAAEATHEATTTASGIGALGIDARALVFQIINFVVLLLILRWVAYKPILTMLDKRRATIETSLKQAKSIEATKKEIQQEQQRVMQETYSKSQTILKDSQAQAERVIKAAQEKAAAQSEVILQGARARIDDEVRMAKRELKKETVALIAQATEYILHEKLDDKRDEAIIAHAISTASNRSKSRVR